MSKFSNEQKFKELIAKAKDTSEIIKDEMILISGDFYGIQKFIFDRLSTKNASKVLRAKSAYIQIFTEYLARYICNKLKISEESILSMNAGKFEILAPKREYDLKAIQNKVDEFFVKNFYGLSGVMISSVTCKAEDFKDTTKYKALRKNIIDSVEDKKFQKFNLNKKDAFSVLSYDTNIDNQTLCPICNIRKIEDKSENCKICNSFVELGKKLSFEHLEELVDSSWLGIDFDKDFIIDIELNKKIKSYILFDGRSPADFKVLADNSCKDLETGIKSLAILKADVDNMGKFLENSDVTNSFENFDLFSKTMDNFFSIYIPNMMKEKYPNSYTVFAGGDDLFLLGAWDEILEMAREIEREFKAFVMSDELSISFGIAIAKPSTPISYLADYTEHLLEEAKGIDNEVEVAHPKDAISLFRETVKWKDYLSVYNKLYGALEDFEEHLNTAFLYRLLELIEMSKKLNYDRDIPSAMWKSKFRYSFNRNVLEKLKKQEQKQEQKQKAEDMLKLLVELIDRQPKETKMVVNEFIYKRRAS
jgi:CRISPR-associated protein Csm1